MKKNRFSRNMAGFLLVIVALGGMAHFYPPPPSKRVICTGPGQVVSHSNKLLTKILSGKGNEAEKALVYSRLNRFGNPVAVFNLNMKPILWNDSARGFEGEYEDTLPVVLDGVRIGTVGVVQGHQLVVKRNSPNGSLAVLLAFVLLGMIAVGSQWAITLFAMILLLQVILSPLPCYLFLFAGALHLRSHRIPALRQWLNPLFAGFMALFFVMLFQRGFNAFHFYTALYHSPVLATFGLAWLAGAFFSATRLHWFSVLILLSTVFFSVPAFILCALIGTVAYLFQRLGKPWHAILLISTVAILVLATLYGETWFRMSRLVSQNVTEPAEIEARAFQDLDRYLEIAETGGFRDLLDYLRSSGLVDSTYDFEAVYFNQIGEIISFYSRGIPEVMSLPAEHSVETLSAGRGGRRVVAGTAPFKYGILSLRLSADLYTLSFLKPGGLYSGSFQIRRLAGREVVRIVTPGIFQVLSDLAFLILLGMILYVSFSKMAGPGTRGLFARTVLGQFAVLTGFLTLVGILLMFQSRTFTRSVSKEGLYRTADMASHLLERDEPMLSDSYLGFLKTLIHGDYSLYSKGLVVFSTNHLQTPVLLSYPAYLKSTTGESREAFFEGEYLYVPLTLNRYPASVLQIRPLGSWETTPFLNGVRALMIVLVLFLLVSFLISAFLTRKIVDPILLLSEASEGISRGDYKVAIHYDYDDEMGTLISAMEQMALSLKNQRLNLEALLGNVSSAVALVGQGKEVVASNPLFGKLPVEITEGLVAGKGPFKTDLVLHGRNYQISVVQLENGNHVVIVDDVTDVVRASRLSVIGDMARQVAHDIKNPLTPIRLNAEFLESVAKKEPRKLAGIIPRVVENILKKTEELKAISAQFSDLVRASRKSPERLRRINLKEFISSLVETYLNLSVEIIGPEVVVMGDSLKLTRVLGNLLENTYSFSGESGEVRIEIHETGEKVILDYRDNGKGIPPENVAKVFEPYFSTRESGTGLGLFISREFMHEMGGEIEAVPCEEGAHFRIILRTEGIHVSGNSE
ncbi:MAG: HAMP domain-containing protein [Acidobacteria bacterium]|nr:HAMP domain-containing protein [Acidobacteriota bacterium]